MVAVCLLSGGLDSSVSAYIAKKTDHHDVYALSFLYGQRHDREIESAKKIASMLSSKKHILFNLDLAQFKGSSLIKSSNESIPENISLNSIGSSIPSTYVPARNTVFLSLALAFAETVDADAIYIGVTAADYSGYPDCRPEFINSFQSMINLATKKTVEGKSITLETPLISLSKSEIVTKGNELDVPFKYTWSCYKGLDQACGVCDSCQLRLKGFKDAGFKDPLKYDTLPSWY